MGYANNRFIIGGLVRIEIKFSDRCEVTHLLLIFFLGWGEGELPQGIVVALYNTYV